MLQMSLLNKNNYAAGSRHGLITVKIKAPCSCLSLFRLQLGFDKVVLIPAVRVTPSQWMQAQNLLSIHLSTERSWMNEGVFCSLHSILTPKPL